MSDLDDLSDLADSRAFSWSGGYKNGMKARRGRPPSLPKLKVSTCGAGHELTPENVRTYKVDGGKRWRWACRECDRKVRNMRMKRRRSIIVGPTP